MTALEKIGKVEETLPDSVMKKYNLCPLDSAIRQIHFPDSREDIEIARKRLIFEELLTLQIGLMKLKDKKETTNNYKIKTAR